MIPILEYPAIPICAASLTQKRNMQTVINKALKFIDGKVDNGTTVEQLHIQYNITPANISIDHRAKKTWEAVKATEPHHYNNLIINYEREHMWFPKTSRIINEETPNVIITRHL